MGLANNIVNNVTGGATKIATGVASGLTTGVTTGVTGITTGVTGAAKIANNTVQMGANIAQKGATAVSDGVKSMPGQTADIAETCKSILPSFLTTQTIDIRKLLKLQVSQNASDLHIITNEKPRFRTKSGSIIILNDFPKITEKDTKEVIKTLMPNKEKYQIFMQEHAIDVAVEAKGIGRFRMNAYMERNGIGMVFRILPSTPPTLESIDGENGIIEKLARLDSGLVLIAGKNDSGKTTTIGAMVDYINKTRDRHIMILEDPIEIIHKPIRSLISHREIGKHSKNYEASIKNALRQDIDIVVIGEMRDLETISAAIEMAESGYLVLATVHTGNAVDSIQHLVGSFSKNKQDLVQHQLSTLLKGIICQKLLPNKDNTGRVACREILINNENFAEIIQEGEYHKIPQTMDIKNNEGNITFDEYLIKLLDSGKISQETYVKNTKK